ncbi:MAG: hypothetical protein HQM06_16100 [Magnetococcales bacterium]|nr:hypothetical protein [Magnetococcales bacterium]
MLIAEGEESLLEKNLIEIIKRFKSDHILYPRQEVVDAAYLVDVYQKKRGKFIYLCAKYRCPMDDCHEEYYEIKFARIKLYNDGTFNLAHVPYMAKKGRWCDLYERVGLNECINIINNDELFHP